jgi:hypothetical protein
VATTARTLRDRILGAVIGASALSGEAACRSQELGPDRPSPRVVASDPTPLASSLSSAKASAPEAPEPPPRPATVSCGASPSHEGCYAPFTNARSTGTGEPAPPPPRSAYDKNGCLPQSLVSNGCCNGAVGGPAFKGGQCCYQFCLGPCCGRPFVVAGRARVAPLVPSSSWLAPGREAGRENAVVDPATAEALGRAWLDDALMEHASVASFARFTLQLLGVGAPADLVRDATTAATDEVHHATLCFAVAARLVGRRAEPLGPAALGIDGALGVPSLAEIVHDAVLEGCVGETIAALVAHRRLERARDAGVRAALARIAEDESRHAELAWRFLRWALDVGGEPVRRAALAAFDQAELAGKTASPAGARADVDEAAWLAYGRLLPAAHDRAVREAHAQVVAPCRDAIVTRSSRPAAGSSRSSCRR